MSDLHKTVTMRPPQKLDAVSGPPIGRPVETTLFEAVRKWTDDEHDEQFDIVDGDRRLAEREIKDIASSKEFEAMLLAYNERR